MSKGDLKTQGLKGNNFPYQFNVLQLLGMIVGNTDQVEALLQAIEDNTDGVEGLLSQILAAVQTDKDFETSFVKDANGQVWLEVRTLDIDTGVWTISYFLPGDLTPHQLQPGDPAGPLGPLTYESPASLLALILAELVAHTALLTDIDNNTDNIEPLLTQLEACCQAGNLLLQNIDAKDFASETTLALIEAVTAQMTFTGGDLNVSANIQVGDTDVSGANPVPVTFPAGTETPNYLEYTGILLPTATPAGAKSVSLFNEGPSRWELSSNGGVSWVNFNEGQIVEWSASEGKTLNSILFRRTVAGGRLIMSYTI